MFHSIEKYLDHKLSDIRQYKCTKIHFDGQTCGSCWWRGVTRENKNITRCGRCVHDTEKFNEIIKTSKKTCDFHADCTYNCLWWDWYNNERQNESKRLGIALNYIRDK